MNHQERAQVQQLQQRVAALERLVAGLRGSHGVSTNYGALNVRTTQLGFAAELTSAYDGDAGYSWSRLFLDTTAPGLTNPGVQPTGDGAFEVTGNTTLGAGDRVWLEPSPDASGYLFTLGWPGISTCQGCGWLAALRGRTDVCLKLTVTSAGAGECACIDTDQVLYLESADGLTWGASSPLQLCCGEGDVSFVLDQDGDGGGRHRLVIATGAGTCPSGTTAADYFFTPDCCTDTYVYFKGGGDEWCDDPQGSHPNEDPFTVRLEVSDCCPNDDYAGPGWYCMSGACAELAQDPGDCVSLAAGGPHASEAACQAACSPAGVSTDCCPGDPIPEELAAALTGCSGTAETTLTYNPLTETWQSPPLDCLGGDRIVLECTGSGTGGLVAQRCGDTCANVTVDSASCDPFGLTFTVGGVTVVVSE